MPPLKKFVNRLKDLSPAGIREIIVVFMLLSLAIILSIPAFREDLKNSKRYKEQLKISNTFEYATPVELGMNPALLEQAAEYLENTSAVSFIIVRRGKIAYEKYYMEAGSNNIFSITKSFISALTGIAIREGYIGSIDDKIEVYLPEYFKELSDPRWKQITIRHLLTMTPGFCENLEDWTSSEDWVKATFNLPLVYNPGEKFQYANSASHLLSVILTRATGMKMNDFAGTYLFQPLGIANPGWTTDPSGYYSGYANLYLKPIDLAKFGWLYYSSGKWENTQVIPEEWVKESTEVHVDLNQDKGLGYENGYGYKWWISGSTGYHAYSALGFGGQSISVIPELDLEVVITSRPDFYSIKDEGREKLLKEYIVASITD